MQFSLIHYLSLAAAIALGTALRFWHLAWKPLWLDETITALFALGRNYQDLPLEQFFPLSSLEQILHWQPASCIEIAQAVATQSTHPPLFFCLIHHWLGWLTPLDLELDWKLRALPALLGVAAIAAIYVLNRVAFAPAAGLMAAALMAVSPFAVYLSQEARHYTLPMLMIILALLGLVQIQQDLNQQRLRLAVWGGWVAINGIGFYVHYFFLLAFVAQVLALSGWMVWRQPQMTRRTWGILLGVIASVTLMVLPWLLIFQGHGNRPETDWLQVTPSGWLDYLGPFYRMLGGLIVMVILLPVEDQPLWIVLPSALGMILFAGWLLWLVSRRLGQLWHQPQSRDATRILSGFAFWAILEYLAIALILGKDLTLAFRYNFTFYPAICALLGASLVNLPSRWFQDLLAKKAWRSLRSPQPIHPAPKPGGLRPRQIQGSILLVGIISSIFVLTDLGFQKPFFPQAVAQDLIHQTDQPILIVQKYLSWQDVARGLSIARAVQRQAPQLLESSIYWSFVPGTPTAAPLWEQIPQIPPSLRVPFHLWMIDGGRSATTYPAEISFKHSPQDSTPPRGAAIHCKLNPSPLPRSGTSRQRYQCAFTNK